MNILFYLGILLLFAIIFIIYFLRDPVYQLPNVSSSTILSPAYGKVYKIFEHQEEIHIIVILNIFDIHTQYYPIQGKVISQIYDASGRFSIIYNFNKSRFNEKMITIIQPNIAIKPIKVIQIAGLTTRRIITYPKVPQESVKAGEKLGKIVFGSRIDLILPKDNLKLFVTEGQKVYGPHTIIGEYI